MAKQTQKETTKATQTPKVTSTLDGDIEKVVAFAFGRAGRGANAGGTVKSVSFKPAVHKAGKKSRVKFNMYHALEAVHNMHKAKWDAEAMLTKLKSMGHAVDDSGQTVYAIGITPGNGTGTQRTHEDIVGDILRGVTQ